MVFLFFQLSLGLKGDKLCYVETLIPEILATLSYHLVHLHVSPFIIVSLLINSEGPLAE